MTNSNSAAQAAMQEAVSDADLLRICQQFSPGQDLDLAKAVRAEVLSKLRAPVPDGWRLVPVEPTPGMIDAACDVDCPQDGAPAPATVYAAMIGAAPPAPEASAPVAEQGNVHGLMWNTNFDPQERQRAWTARQSRLAQGGATVAAKEKVDKILRDRMAPISEALGLDVMLASVFKDGFQIITFEFETLVYSIGSNGAAILRVSFNCSHAPDTLTVDQVQIISQAVAEVRPVGGEVLAWLDQHRGITSRPATAVSSLELYRQWRAAEQAQAAAPCTCPSGDGSLRHPCAEHPPTYTNKKRM